MRIIEHPFDLMTVRLHILECFVYVTENLMASVNEIGEICFAEVIRFWGWGS